jgi:hypothetical protein
MAETSAPPDRAAKEQIGRLQPDWILYQANLKANRHSLSSASPPMSSLLSCKQLLQLRKQQAYSPSATTPSKVG